jgi:hypothetical protein
LRDALASNHRSRPVIEEGVKGEAQTEETEAKATIMARKAV